VTSVYTRPQIGAGWSAVPSAQILLQEYVLISRHTEGAGRRTVVGVLIAALDYTMSRMVTGEMNGVQY